MPARLFLLAAAALFMSSCGEDKFDQRYRDTEAQIREEDKALASELPGSPGTTPAKEASPAS